MAARARKIPSSPVSAALASKSYEEWNMAKLRKEMKRRGLSYSLKKKADLVRACSNAWTVNVNVINFRILWCGGARCI